MCNEVSGECECAPNVIGERCGQCDADSYGYDDVLGCKDCDCDVEGATDPSCDDEGICFCKKSSITGGSQNYTLSLYHAVGFSCTVRIRIAIIVYYC